MPADDKPAATLEDCRCDHIEGVNCCGTCECITNTVAPEGGTA